MEVLEVAIFILVIFWLLVWALSMDKRDRARQYDKFLGDISRVFYSALNQKAPDIKPEAEDPQDQ